jgi:hypothetical protein
LSVWRKYLLIVIPAQAEIQRRFLMTRPLHKRPWILACAEMTGNPNGVSTIPYYNCALHLPIYALEEMSASMPNHQSTTASIPDSREERNALIAATLTPFMRRLGFHSTTEKDSNITTFKTTTNTCAIEVFGNTFGKTGPSEWQVIVSVRFPEVQRIINMFSDWRRDKAEFEWTYRFSITQMIEKNKIFYLDSIQDLDHLKECAETIIPTIIRACQHIVIFDAFVNGQRETTDDDPWEIYISYSMIVVAYMAGNPNFDVMVVNADARVQKTEKHPISNVMLLAQYLKSNVVPIRR